MAHILLSHQALDSISPEIEQEANELAVELMLPGDEFRQQMRALDLPGLKEHFSHASWEVIGRRWTEFRPAVLTIYDNQKLTSRGGPAGLAFPVKISKPEREIIRECYKKQCHCFGESENLILNCYFIDEGSGVQRVLLLSETKF